MEREIEIAASIQRAILPTTLPAVNRKYASSYHLEPDSVDADGGFDAQPFIVLKSAKAKGTSKATASKKK